MEPRGDAPDTGTPNAPTDVLALQARANVLLWEIGARVWRASRQEAYRAPLAIRKVGERTYEWYRRSVRFEDLEVNRLCAEVERLQREISGETRRQVSRAIEGRNDPD
jgi:hypothetical protein